MTNPYRFHLNSFFETITDFKHAANRLNKVLLNDVKIYTAEGAGFFSGTALVIGDWTGPTDNGWKLKFHTGIQKSTFKENYANEINAVLSREFGLAFAQCFEALERFLKRVAREKGRNNQEFQLLLLDKKYSTGDSLKGGDAIFDLIKKAGGLRFKEYSRDNNHNFKFKEIFTIFAEVRHAVTHSQGELKVIKLMKSDYYNVLFEYLFPFNKLKGEVVPLVFDYRTMDRLLTYLAEFGYQIFKILSEEEKLDWRIE
ncbi:hypothetical protein L0U88_15175 [Flavihumibacter sp. RY-1]|uniref:RiboL-PSP-HEPN domain-containing protein n=1 Tax=Flavihumibacter fluminis TaxID=2909236 RepID=A0ABS9BK08_9BACT|nr:hypothetical protein [Flavihumibacter fluminis]MCF1715981.1 hypothetical protein [Flavihumibacter fluminis]